MGDGYAGERAGITGSAGGISGLSCGAGFFFVNSNKGVNQRVVLANPA